MKQILNKKGFVLLLTLLIMASLAAITGALIFSLTTDFRQIGVRSKDAKALWLSEAGIEKATWYLKTPPARGGQGENWTTAGLAENLGDGNYLVKVDPWDFALSTNGSTASASSASFNSQPANAIDNNNQTYWESSTKPTVANPQTLTVQFSYPLVINKIKFRPIADSGGGGGGGGGDGCLPPGPVVRCLLDGLACMSPPPGQFCPGIDAVICPTSTFRHCCWRRRDDCAGGAPPVPAGGSGRMNYEWQVSSDGTNFTTIFTGANVSLVSPEITDEFGAQSGVKYLRLKVTDSGRASPSHVGISTLTVVGNKITSTGTADSLTRKVEQTVVVDDNTQTAYDEIDWNEI